MKPAYFSVISGFRQAGFMLTGDLFVHSRYHVEY